MKETHTCAGTAVCACVASDIFTQAYLLWLLILAQSWDVSSVRMCTRMVGWNVGEVWQITLPLQKHGERNDKRQTISLFLVSACNTFFLNIKKMCL